MKIRTKIINIIDRFRDSELSRIYTPILSLRPFKCFSLYNYEYSVDLDKTCLFKKSIKLRARILVIKYDQCIPSFHICVLKILSLKVRPNLFNTNGSLCPKNIFYLLQWNRFKSDEKCCLLHLKITFRSRDISVFVLAFWLCRKIGLIRNLRLILKFMTSQPG